MENYLYYDLDLYNDTNSKIQCRFSDKRSDSILTNIENYLFSITRFEISTLCLPAFIPKMNDSTHTAYNASTGNISINAIHDPYYSVSTPPTLTANYYDNEYYYYYSYGHVLDIFNTMFLSLKGPNDPITVSLNNMFLEINIPVGYTEIYFNNDLKNLFALFNYRKINEDKYELIIQRDPNNLSIEQKLISENTVGYLFSPVQQICFISETVPVTSILKSNIDNIITNKKKTNNNVKI